MLLFKLRCTKKKKSDCPDQQTNEKAAKISIYQQRALVCQNERRIPSIASNSAALSSSKQLQLQ
jgi:hypothetical protein